MHGPGRVDRDRDRTHRARGSERWIFPLAHRRSSREIFVHPADRPDERRNERTAHVLPGRVAGVRTAFGLADIDERA